MRHGLAGVLLIFACLIVPSLALAQAPAAGDQWLSQPVDARTFKTYLEFFTYDTRLPLDLRASKVEDDQGLRRERLSFQSTPGVRVTAVLWQPGGPATGKRPAVIVLHGGSAAGKDSPNAVATATLLARAGFAALAIDLPHFGERATELLTTFAEQEKHDRLYNQPSVYLGWVTQIAKDVSRSFDLLVGERGADPGRVALIGNSRGAIVGAIAMAIERRLCAIVLLFGGHFDALETNHLPAACPANYIGRIAPRPLLMINGTQDSDMIKDLAVEPLFKVAKQPKQILWTDGGHGFMTEVHRAALLQWLRDKMK
jgi:pimeloyl-ACP methyl ester carboxylesterase